MVKETFCHVQAFVSKGKIYFLAKYILRSLISILLFINSNTNKEAIFIMTMEEFHNI